MWLAFVVFTCCLMVDVLFVLYMNAVAKRNGPEAGMWSALVFAMGALTVLLYIDDHRMLVPALLGNFVGPWIGVKLSPDPIPPAAARYIEKEDDDDAN